MATGLVVMTAQPARAAGLAPGVAVTPPSSYIAGEDLPLGITFTGSAGAGAQYNLSAGVVLSSDVTVVDTGSLGAPTTYAAGTVLPGAITAGTTPNTCAALGLENAPVPPGPNGACRVPAGTQYLVFQNISDLPEGASVSHTLTVRPNAAIFGVGASFPYQVNAYTNGDERFLPVFPGSTGLASEAAQELSSNAGVADDDFQVNALRIEKSEPSPESELLRGVHQNTTTYTLRVWHTGEGDIENVVVTDLLPAGLEYLGLGGVDNTTNANGNRGGGDDSVEYDGAGRLDATPVPADSDWGGAADPSRNANVGEIVETITQGGAVYTRVTWNIGELLAAGLASYSILDPVKQVYSATAGEPGFFEIRYRAAVPLFENTMDFDGAGGQPTADQGRGQIANLDNNRGGSTRHGSGDDPAATTYTNRATVTGSYAGASVTDEDTEQVDAVDVRLLKSVDTGSPDGLFVQGQIARYTLNIATSEYVSAELGARPDRLVDDLADGLCPVFPTGTDAPRLFLGDPNDAGSLHEVDTPEEWNDALDAVGVSEDCHFPSTTADPAEDVLEGATVTGIAFDAEIGGFFLELSLPAGALPAGNGDGHNVRYSVVQNPNYIQSGAGATTSGDRFVNAAEIHATTQAIEPVEDLTNSEGTSAGNTEGAWDDSSATLGSGLTSLDKRVLRREAGVPDRTEVVNTAAADWVQVAETPFAVGDEVWYRIRITPPTGIDVRNPRFTDFLPQGVTFDPTLDGTGRPVNTWIVPSSTQGIGTCRPGNAVDWLNRFVPPPTVRDNVVNFALGAAGADCGLGGTDRFLPLSTTLTIYLKVTVTDLSAFGQVDLPQNLAKYQQENVDGELFFLRDAAEIELDRSARLTKGIRSINGTEVVVETGVREGDDFNSDIDGLEVVQDDQVTFRLDVTAPFTDTNDYLIWDVLPEGIKAADINAGSYSAKLVEDGVEGADATFTAEVFDYPYSTAPSNVLAQLRDPYRADQRSIIVWNVTSVVPGSTRASDGPPVVEAVERGLTLGYTVTIPNGTVIGGGAAALIDQEYVNNASIIEFDTGNSQGGDSTLIVNGTENVAEPRTPSPGPAGPEFLFDDLDNDTSDLSNVFLPNIAMTKQLVGSEILGNGTTTPDDPLNASNIIVQGEHATFDYQVTIPANTTVREGVLFDLGNFVGQGAGNIQPGNDPNLAFPYKFVAASLPADRNPAGLSGLVDPVSGSDPAAQPARFSFRTDTGKLIFPEYYSTGDSERTFTVRITVWTSDTDASNPTASLARPNIPHNKLLANTAVFESKNLGESDQTRQGSGSAEVRYREPNLVIAKSASPASNVAAGQDITYTLEVSNVNRVKSYDNTVVDTVPVGLLVQPNSFRVGGVAIADSNLAFTGDVFGGAGGTITWSHANVAALREIPGTATLTYIARIDPTTGAGRTYTNTANVTGYTLPSTLPDAGGRRGDRFSSDDATVTAIRAGIAKDVRLADTSDAFGNTVSAPIGDTVEYRVDITLRANVNYYDPRIVDDLPAGVVLDTASIVGPGLVSGTPLGGTWNRSYNAAANAYTWSYSEDILSAPADRTLRLTYRVDLANSVAANVNSLPNTASFTWGPTDGAPEGSRQSINDPANVAVVNPVLGIAKDVKFSDETNWRQTAEGDPDRTLNYRIIVTNTGNTPSFHNTVVDTLPAGVVNPRDFTIDGVAVSAPNTVSTSGNTVTWTIPGEIRTSAVNQITLGYTADFAASGQQSSDVAGQGVAHTNVAAVQHYESFPRDPSDPGTATGRVFDPANVRADAQARPLFPRVTLSKSVADTSRTAYVGEPFEWILTATNSGRGAAQRVVLTDTLPQNWTYTATTSITVAGSVVTPPTEPTGPAGGPLVWTFGSDATSGSPAAILQPGQSIVIRYTATPTDPDALTAPGVGSSNPHVNTLSAVTTDRTNATANQSRPHTGPNAQDNAFLREADLKLVKEAVGGTRNDAYGLPNGSWVPGASIGADYAQPQWRITVDNHGPDTSYGPFEFTDTPTSPAGVTVDPASLWQARYYSSASDTTGTALTLTPGPGNTFTVGDRSTLLTAGPGGAAGPDRIVITANVTIAAGAVGTAENEATVDGRTYENPVNKPESATNPNIDEASKPLTPVADLAIEKVVNTADPAVGGPITWGITVTNLGPSVSVSSPAEPVTITDTVPAGVAGVTATSNADWSVQASDGFPAEAGDVITWTYRGTGMPVGGTAQVTLSGAILSSHTGELVNRAEVGPGETPDPVDPNNTDEVPVTPNDDTMLTVLKTRVVKVGDDWVFANSQDPVPPFVAGDPVSYRIDVRNTGAADARELTVVDESPEGLSYASHEGLGGTSWGRTAGGTNAGGTSDAGWDTFELTTPSTLPAGETRSFVVTYDTEPTITGDVVNWAEASAENSTNEPRDPDDSGSNRQADLSIVKSHTSPAADEAAVAGGSVDYRLVVTNHGPSDSSASIDVSDTLPAGFSYRSGSASVIVAGGAATAVAPTVAGRILTWTDLTSGADLALNATIVISFTADVDPATRAQTGLLNLADVSGPEDTEPDNNHDDDPVDVVTETVMEITKDVEAGPWVAGTDVEYTLTIRNDGPSEAPASVTDTLPVGLSMVSMSGTGWDCSAVVEGAQDGTCAFTGNDGLHPVGAGNATAITVTARIAPTATDLPQPLQNRAVLTWSDSEGSHTDDDDADITVTRVADLGIAKTALDAPDGEDTDTAVAGESLWYRLVVRNEGPSAAIAPIVVNDALPAGTSFLGLTGASAANWGAVVDAANPQLVTFTRTPEIGILPGQTAPEIVFEVMIDASVADDEELVNTAEIDEVTLDPNDDGNDENDSDDAEVTVHREVNLSIEKTHVAAAPDEFPIGAELQFVLDATNAGPSVATGIRVTDTLPAGLEYLGLAGTGWSLVGSPVVNENGTTTVTAEFDDELAAGESAPTLTLTVRVTVGIGDAQTSTNQACVDPAEENTNPDPCDTDEIVTVPLADLAIAKSAVTPADEVGAGRELSWQLDVRNLGPSDSVSSQGNPITVTDEIPAGMIGVADPSTDQWTATVTRNGEPGAFPARAGDLVTWTFLGERIVANPDPDADPAHSLTLTGRIDASWTGGEVLNLAAVTPGETRDPEDPNNTDEDTVTPGDGTSLRIDKTRVVKVDDQWVIAAEQDPVPPFEPGTDLSYLITVVNDGPADARSVTVVDETPDGLTYRAHESVNGTWQRAAGGTSSTGDQTNWDTFTLDGSQPVGPEGARSFVVTYATDSAMAKDAVVVNWAEVTAENWPGGYDRDDDDITSNRSADLSLVKTHTSPAPGEAVFAGETVDYRLVVTNHGPSVSDAPIVVTDTLPAGFGYVPDTATVSVDGGEPVAAAPDVDERRLTWADISGGETLAVGSTVVISFTALVWEDHDAAQGVLNAAVVDGPNDNNPVNDRDDDPIDVTVHDPLVTLVVEKTAVGEFQVGKTGTFEITVTNLGPNADPGPITVTDTLPAGLAFHSSPDAEVEVDGRVVTWTIPDGLAVGESRTFTLVVRVLQGSYPEVTNTVIVETPTETTPDSQLADDAIVEVEEGEILPITGATIVGGLLSTALALLLLGLAGVMLARGRRESGEVEAS